MTAQSRRPIFVATHPRSCSTAFERVFMTRTDDLNCIHEPFGEPFYYGPERLSSRYEGDDQLAVKSREATGYQESTYKSVLDDIENEENKDKRIFIKDMASYLVPPDDNTAYKNAQFAPSLQSFSNKTTITKNPTVVPLEILEKFQFAFLIRDPRRAIPSYYRCCIPPLSKKTGFEYFMPNEAGYRELRELFDFLRNERVLKATAAENRVKQEGINGSNGTNGINGVNGDHIPAYEACIIDADDLLDHPKEVIQKFCQMVGMEFHESMLEWEANQECGSFDKWKGFHEDAIGSAGLKPRTVKKTKTREQEMQEWIEKYGEEGAKVINQTAEENMADYEYLKQFKIDI